MKRTLILLCLLALSVGAAGGCSGDTNITGDNNCYAKIEGTTDGWVQVDCGTGEPLDEEKECYSPGGTRLHPSECE